MRDLVLAAALLLPWTASADTGEARFQPVRVQPGDTLWAIANSWLKDPKRWNEILKHNQLPTRDPTVALPGMVLQVPVFLIKEEKLAAKLIHVANRVEKRPKDSAKWVSAVLQEELFKDYGLRTYEASRARVQFVTGEELSVEPNSMAILKPRALEKDNIDLQLDKGAVYARQARVVTASARITPKVEGTVYSAEVRDDLSTRVQVHAGRAEVEGAGKTIEIKAGLQVDVMVGRVPALPTRIPKAPNLGVIFSEAELNAATGNLAPGTNARAPGALPGGVKAPGLGEGAPAPAIEDINIDIGKMKVGVPVSAFRIQASRSPEFDKLLFDKVYDADEKIDFNRLNLSPGTYWWRIAMVDLLGVEGKFSQRRQYVVGGGRVKRVTAVAAFKSLFEVVRPAEGDETSRIPKYRLLGKADRDLAVTINGATVSLDSSGGFSLDVVLRTGPNRYTFHAVDRQGNEREIVRTLTYEP